MRRLIALTLWKWSSWAQIIHSHAEFWIMANSFWSKGFFEMEMTLTSLKTARDWVTISKIFSKIFTKKVINGKFIICHNIDQFLQGSLLASLHAVWDFHNVEFFVLLVDDLHYGHWCFKTPGYDFITFPCLWAATMCSSPLMMDLNCRSLTSLVLTINCSWLVAD